MTMAHLDSETMGTMAKKAQQIWAMLDDMAENDPSSYRKFIDQQIKDGKESMAPPSPHMCVLVTLYSKPPKSLYINFCSWNRVPEPKTPTDPVPVAGVPIIYQEDSFAITSVAFNSKVLEEYGRNTKNPVDGETLIQLALDYIEAQQNVKLSRTYTVLPEDTSFKGNFELVSSSFNDLLSNKNHTLKEDEEIKKVFGSVDTESFLYQFSNLSGNHKRTDHLENFGVNEKSMKSTLFTTSKNNKLIEEIKEIKPLTPKYKLEMCDISHKKHLVLKVELGNVKSVSQCELDVSTDDVMLIVPGQYELKVKLPSCVDDEQSKAKFCKKSSTLTVTMPIKC
ncbi:PIH1 domain-containing protein 2 [Bulinus truncatus]|nr:PIH1 domain-containing protein 2 [Bulinus truncatus]